MLSSTDGASGGVTEQLIDHYAHAAEGRPAMIMVEVMAVAGRYVFLKGQLRIDDAKFMRGLRRLVEAIHLNEVACEFQLHYAGAFGIEPISPSGIAC